MMSFRHSITRRLMMVMLTTTFVTLAVFAATMLWVDIRGYRTFLANDLASQAQILGQVSAPALEFNDPRAAHENLEQLRARPQITLAALYDANGSLVASYSADPLAVPVFPGRPDFRGYRVEGNRIALFLPFERNGRHVGTVYLAAHYDLWRRLREYLSILGAVTAFSLVIGALIGAWLQKAITRPLLSVSDTAREIVARRDFSLKATRSTDDEIGVLVDAFNDMLEEVKRRAEALEASNTALSHEANERRAAERALQHLNETLAARIAARTAELEEAHEHLRHSQKMEAIGQLTGGVAHDFNNILAVISGNIELMKLKVKRDQYPDLARHLDSTSASIERATALTHRLLAFSRRQTLDPKATDINRLIASMSDLIQRTIDPSIRFDVVLAPEPMYAMCDPHQLENAILNLVINARDAMPSGGSLTITTRSNTVVGDDGKERRSVDITVSDTGVGMTPEVMERAVEPFFTTKALGQGTGLGLSMVYGFVSQSGGQLRMQSEPGKGTVMQVVLPAIAAQPEPEPPPAVVHDLHAPRRATLLLVDDEAELRRLAHERLAELGYTVLEAADGAQALRVLQSDTPVDMLVSDIGLPGGMNGRELAEAAAAARPDIPILLITGYAHMAAMSEFLSEHEMDILTKPFRMDDLAARIGRILREGRRKHPA